jgi:hypothetical protein
MVARSTAHQSLVAAAPLAFFLLFVLRAADTRSLRDAALAGLCAAWAGICDAYYGLYCLPILAVVVLARTLRFERSTSQRPHRLAAIVTVLMILPAVAAAAILLTGGGTISAFGRNVRATTLYTPMLILTALAIVRLALAVHQRGSWRVEHGVDRSRLAQFAIGGLVCVLLLAPLLQAAWVRVQSGGSLQEETRWRSSPAGVDLLWFLVPNPNHPLAPEAWRDFVTTRPDSYAENVASIPYVAMVVIAFALAHRPRPKVFMALAVCFGLLALGPFLTVAHANTQIPGPWALLRYVPVLGAARTPTRFAIPMLMAIAVIFAWALERVGRRRATVALVAAALAFELWPGPRETASAAVPRVYATIATDRDDVTVLEVPFGIWDGTTQRGFANIATTYYQTTHQKRLVGGYLSRVPPGRVREHLRYPTLRMIVAMSEGTPVEPNLAEAAHEDAEYFVRTANLRYVVVDPRLASADLRHAAIELLRLELVQAADGLELYRTGF